MVNKTKIRTIIIITDDIMVLNYNNYIQFNRGFFSIPLSGIDNIKKSFNPHARKIIFLPETQKCQSFSLSLQDRVQYFFIGLLLITPVMNLVASYTLRHFTTIEHDSVPVHQSAGVLPYAEKNGKLYLLLGQERSGLWCDFGGASEHGEMPEDTGAREGWEEIRGILGDLTKMRKQVYKSPTIGKVHSMFLTKVKNPEKVTDQTFKNVTFMDSCRMEKQGIAWVEAEKVFQAVRNNTNQFSDAGNVYKLRGCFAKNIAESLTDPESRSVIAKLSNNISTKVQCHIPSDCTLGICAEPSWGANPIAFTKSSNQEWIGEVPTNKEFKFVIINQGNRIQWENGFNRRIHTPMGLTYQPTFA